MSNEQRSKTDASASKIGKMDGLRAWWDKVTELGPEYGYFPNPTKTWLVVKEEHLEAATHSGGLASTQGRQYLGAPIGSKEFIDLSVKKKVDAWVADVEKLAFIAKTHPHVAYAAYCHGLCKWKFISRTTPINGVLFTPLETAIRNHLLPSILGKQDISDSMRKILALPTQCGGLGLANPQEDVTREYTASRLLSRHCRRFFCSRKGVYSLIAIYAKQKQAKTTISQQKSLHTTEATALMLEEVPADL